MHHALRTIAIVMAATLLLPLSPAAAQSKSPRIVTIGSAVTEIVFALGQGKDVVGVDQTSRFPSAVTKLPNVGYMRTLSSEGILSLAPTLIIATADAGPPETIEALKNASVPMVMVPEAYDADAVLRKVRAVAKALGVPKRGEDMARVIAKDFATLQKQRAQIKERRRGVFVFTVGNGAPTLGGGNTSADGLMALGGIANAMNAINGFKPASSESVLAAAPEVVLTMIDVRHGFDADTLFALPSFAGTPAARDRRLVRMPSAYLAFGPRTAHAASRLASEVYPELALEPLPERPWTAAEPTARP